MLEERAKYISDILIKLGSLRLIVIIEAVIRGYTDEMKLENQLNVNSSQTLKYDKPFKETKKSVTVM